MENVNLKINSKGRKWYQVTDLKNNRGGQLLIDDSTKDFTIDSEHAFAANVEDKSDRKYGKIEFTYVSETIAEEVSEANKQSDLAYAKECAVDELTYFVEHYYDPQNHVSRKQYRDLKAKVAKFEELTAEEKTEIAEAEKALENKVEELKEESAKVVASFVNTDSVYDLKLKVVKALRAQGNDTIADILKNEHLRGTEGELILQSYIKKYNIKI